MSRARLVCLQGDMPDVKRLRGLIATGLSAKALVSRGFIFV